MGLVFLFKLHPHYDQPPLPQQKYNRSFQRNFNSGFYIFGKKVLVYLKKNLSLGHNSGFTLRLKDFFGVWWQSMDKSKQKYVLRYFQQVVVISDVAVAVSDQKNSERPNPYLRNWNDQPKCIRKGE